MHRKHLELFLWILILKLIFVDECQSFSSREKHNHHHHVLQRTSKTKFADANRALNQRSTTVNNFYNVIAQDGADPWVFKHIDGWYYATKTTGIDVQIWRSTSLTTVFSGEHRVIWQSNNSGPACRSIWAPELHFVQSGWYVYFAGTTCDDRNENHRMFVLENPNQDPFSGPFSFRGQITDSSNKWAIDGTILELPSRQLYFIWSGWEGDVNVRQNLYIAQMSNPWTISSNRVEISRPTYPWEINHQPYINEGPEITIRNNVILLIYSASGSWTNDYCLGLITSTVTSDLMKATSWQKRSTPIFRSGNNIFGPGHHSLTKSPDNTEDWIVYHSARYSGSGWTRQVRTQSFTWNADSTPNLGVPVDSNTPIRLPSGETARNRYEAENAILTNGPSAHQHPNASNHTKVGYIDYTQSAVKFIIQCSQTGTYYISIRNGNGSAGNALATHWLTINNQSPIEIPIVFSGWDNWGSAIIRVNLNQGQNELIFKKGQNFAEIDMLDIISVSQTKY